MSDGYKIDPNKVRLYLVKPDGTRQEVFIGQTATLNPAYNPHTDRFEGVIEETAVVGHVLQATPISIAWEFKDMTPEQRRRWMDLFGLRFARIRTYVYEKVARWTN